MWLVKRRRKKLDFMYIQSTLDKVYEKEACVSNSINVKDTHCYDPIGAPSVMILHSLLH